MQNVVPDSQGQFNIIYTPDWQHRRKDIERKTQIYTNNVRYKNTPPNPVTTTEIAHGNSYLRIV